LVEHSQWKEHSQEYSLLADVRMISGLKLSLKEEIRP